MTSPVSDAMERVEACMERTGAIESGHGVLLTLCRTDDLRCIIEAMKAKEEAADQSPADEVERVARAMRDCRYFDNDGTDKITAEVEADVNFNALARAALSAIRNGDEGMGGDRARWNCACSNPPFEGDEILRNDGAIACPNCQRPLSGDPEPQRPNK